MEFPNAPNSVYPKQPGVFPKMEDACYFACHQEYLVDFEFCFFGGHGKLHSSRGRPWSETLACLVDRQV